MKIHKFHQSEQIPSYRGKSANTKKAWKQDFDLNPLW